MGEIKITSKNFDQEVLQAKLPVILDFWASWCGPCSMLSPVIEELANDYEGRAIVGKVNVDEEEELANSFHVASIPMVVIVKDGNVKKTLVGYRPKEELSAELDEEL